jgi:hypothetical protein
MVWATERSLAKAVVETARVETTETARSWHCA